MLCSIEMLCLLLRDGIAMRAGRQNLGGRIIPTEDINSIEYQVFGIWYLVFGILKNVCGNADFLIINQNYVK